MSTIAIVSIPVGNAVGSVVCTPINIIDDLVVEDVEYFYVKVEVEDLNIKIPNEAIRSAMVEITDNDGIYILYHDCAGMLSHSLYIHYSRR